MNTPLQQNGHSDHHDPSPAQWRPSGPSPPRPPLPRYASDTSFTSTSSIPLNSSKLKHLKLNKRVSVSDLTKTTNGSDETHVPSEGPPLMTNGFVSVSDLEGGGESTLMRAALSQSKTQNAQLLANHAQLAAQLEAKLRQEKEQRVATEESLQKQLRKEREKRERYPLPLSFFYYVLPLIILYFLYHFFINFICFIIISSNTLTCLHILSFLLFFVEWPSAYKTPSSS